jgi:hypothetical protein
MPKVVQGANAYSLVTSSLPLYTRCPLSVDSRDDSGVGCARDFVERPPVGRLVAVVKPTDTGDNVALNLEQQWPQAQRLARSRLTGELEYLLPLLDNLPANLTQDQIDQICDMLVKTKCLVCLVDIDFDLGCTDLVECRIMTGDAKPYAESLRSHPKIYLDIIDREIEALKQADVIEEASSSWNSNIVCVKKKDGDVRVCVDMRGVNMRHAPFIDRYPLPKISECLDALAGKSWFSSIDVSQSFHQVPIHPDDRYKTAFSTRRGQFQFKRLTMGYSSSPAIYCRLAERILTGLLYTVAIAYVDDTIIMGNSFHEMLLNLDLVFDRFRRAKLKLKPSKCHLFQREIEFCGHIVSEGGRRICSRRSACLDELGFPRNMHELRSLLGFLSYNRAYIANFAELVEPLTAMSRKDVIIEPTEQRLKAFESLKRAIRTAPVLTLARDEGEFVLDTDASLHSLGAVLLQYQDGELRTVEYASRTLSKAERNYCTTRREALAVIFGLRIFHRYLYGRKVTVRCDHIALTHYKSTPNPMGQVARHLAFMEEFDLTIVYRKGSENVIADALSRLPPCMRGKDGEPCKQCHRRMIGHDNRSQVVSTTNSCPEIDAYDMQEKHAVTSTAKVDRLQVVNAVLNDAVLDDTVVVSSDSASTVGVRKSRRIPVPRRRIPDFDYADGRRQLLPKGKEKLQLAVLSMTVFMPKPIRFSWRSTEPHVRDL